jgi:hypothetical protein
VGISVPGLDFTEMAWGCSFLPIDLQAAKTPKAISSDAKAVNGMVRMAVEFSEMNVGSP